MFLSKQKHEQLNYNTKENQMKETSETQVPAVPLVRTQLFWLSPLRPPLALSMGGMVYMSRKQNEQDVVEAFRRTGGVHVGRWEN
jgi:hypothetical protein